MQPSARKATIFPPKIMSAQDCKHEHIQLKHTEQHLDTLPAYECLLSANLALVRRRSGTWHSWYLIPCWGDKCFSMLLVFAPLHDITALHWLHTAEFSSCLVKCSQTSDRFLLSMMLPRSWAWRKCTMTQNLRKTRKPCAGREMRELLRRIDNAGGVQLWWNWSVGIENQFQLRTWQHQGGTVRVCCVILVILY